VNVSTPYGASGKRSRCIRHAIAADLSGIREIYNDVLARSAAIFSKTPSSLDDRGH